VQCHVMPFSRQTINPHHPSILRTIHEQVATPINRGYTHEPHFLTATFFFLLRPAFVREYALLLLPILSLSRIIVVTVPVYCELYMSRLQHPSTVGIPMNHNFSLPHFFFLPSSICTRICVVAATHTVAVQDHRRPSYTPYIGYSRSIAKFSLAYILRPSTFCLFFFSTILYVHTMLFIILVRL
jgi:hypothetical protein